jgi:serine/threonine protein kinase
MERMEGDLTKYKDEEGVLRLGEAEQNRVWVDIAKGLQHLQEKHVLHGDVKPGNILCGAHYKLCDFGVSSIISKEPASEEPVPSNAGTPCYIPPEFLIGEQGHPSDIFAFGVTMLCVFGLMRLAGGSWNISRVRSDAKVQMQMLEWLKVVEDTRMKLPSRLKPLADMLVENPRRRLTASQLVEKLQNCRLLAA